jgi:hypothetical protein
MIVAAVGLSTIDPRLEVARFQSDTIADLFGGPAQRWLWARGGRGRLPRGLAVMHFDRNV